MKMFLRVVTVVFALLGVGVFALAVLVGWMVRHGQDAVALPDQMVLLLDLNAPLREGQSGDPLSAFSARPVYDVYATLDALERAASDPRVKGVFALLSDVQSGPAQVQELRDALLRFRQNSGKPAVVFSPGIGEGGNGVVSYYLASAFDSIVLQPSGMVGTTGLAAEAPFLRNALEMIGVEPELTGRKEYKSAIETLTRTGYSPASAENMQALLDSWMDQFTAGVAESRSLPQDTVRALLGNGPHLAQEAKASGLVTDLGYWDMAWERVAGVRPDDDHAPETVDLGDYARHLTNQTPNGGVKVALILGEGEIHGGPSEDQWGRASDFGSDTVAQAIRDAADDDSIDAILFRINSPGGSYSAADTVWYEVKRATEIKPVVVSMGDMAASGGYFVAAPATRIVAQPGTLTGSIGVFSGKLVLKGLWKHLGVNWESIDKGASAGMWSMNRPFDQRGWDKLNASLDAVYADFTAKVSEGRNLTPQQTEAAARGRVWTGAEARARGLVDTLGGMRVAKIEILTLLDQDPATPVALVPFPQPTASWVRLIRMLEDNAQAQSRMGQVLSAFGPLLVPLGRALGGASWGGDSPWGRDSESMMPYSKAQGGPMARVPWLY